MTDVDAVVREAFGCGASVEGRVRLPGGASRETWALDVVTPDGVRHPLILRSGGPTAGSVPGWRPRRG
ncbi:hypothetical protein ACFSTC_30180 [Nonomuraea ferruginea]